LRKEVSDSTHIPEFTMLEEYLAWGDQRCIARLMQDVILAAADAVGGRQIETPAGTVDLDGDWRWLSVFDGISEAVGEKVTIDTDAETLRGYLDAHEVAYDPKWEAGKLAMELLSELVEPTLVQPTFVCDYPAVAQPLARRQSADDRLIEAWDLVIGGVERGTGFSELIDPVVQREVLEDQARRGAAGDEEAMQLDEDFLRALEYGAPPMGGLGLGIDRTVMMFTGAGIRETILFPHLKPEVR
jgi:lysyl-tRNA synthetase class 2